MKDPRDITNRKVKKNYIEVLEMPNNVFCKELCIFGHHMFDADSTTIYALDGFGYICYDCYAKLKKKKGGKR